VAADELTVCAVTADAGAVAGQRRPPEFVVLVRDGGIAGACARAAATGATWLWLVDASVTPAADALEALLAPLAHAEALGDPILLSSMVLTAEGELDPAAAPWPRLFWKENAIVGAEHGLAALRATFYGSLLVHRRALTIHGTPRADVAGAADDLEWTARLLRETPGYLVSRSVAVRDQRTGGAGASVRSRVRMLRGDAWVGIDKLWFAVVLVREVLTRGAARRRRVGRRIRTLAAGARAR
jgi:hypothetical protein